MDSDFNSLLAALENWHCDSVQAQSYDSQPGAREHSHSMLLAQPYPGPNWRARWARATPEQQGQIIHDLQNELYGLSHSPSQASVGASGLHPGTMEWKLAIARAEGSLRSIARRYGTTHTTVRALKLQFPLPQNL